MNKKFKIFIFILVLSFIFITCEKDDICTDATTPNLIIEFYKFGAITPTKQPVTRLKINVTNYSDLVFDGVTKINIPLKTNTTETQFNFTLNGSNTNVADDNLDVLKFTYSKADIFVSGACGYKTNFYTLTKNLTTDADNWIKSIEIVNPTIENEKDTHVKIYF